MHISNKPLITEKFEVNLLIWLTITELHILGQFSVMASLIDLKFPKGIFGIIGFLARGFWKCAWYTLTCKWKSGVILTPRVSRVLFFRN